MIKDIIGTVIAPFVFGIICLIVAYTAAKQEKNHRYGNDFIADVGMGFGRAIVPILALIFFGLSIINLILILFVKY